MKRLARDVSVYPANKPKREDDPDPRGVPCVRGWPSLAGTLHLGMYFNLNVAFLRRQQRL